MSNKLLEVHDLRTLFKLQNGSEIYPVDGNSFYINKGEIVGLVGESGCGKSMTALSLIKLVPPPGEVSEGQVIFHDRDILTMSNKEISQIRGARISTIFQDPLTYLNPVYTIAKQIGETIQKHMGLNKRAAYQRTLQVLKDVKIPTPERVAKSYPFELSGGMRQRVLIAIAMCCNPELIIADEPTTALDVTVQAQVLGLLSSLVRDNGISMLMITHDMGIVADICDRVYVMYAGQIVESGTIEEIFYQPEHPYSQALLKSVLTINERQAVINSIPGVVPDPENIPSGCRFLPRCQKRRPLCEGKNPELYSISPTHQVKCLLYADKDVHYERK